MDCRDLVGGEQWDTAVVRAIKACEFFVACISARSRTKRGYLQKEIALGLDIWQQKLVSDIYLIPLRLDETPPEERLEALQWIDYSPELGIRPLLRALRVGADRIGYDAVDVPANELTDNVEVRELAVVMPRGYINNVAGEPLVDLFYRLLGAGKREFILDLQHTKTINSIGISCLIEIVERILDHEGAIVVCNARPTLEKSLSVLGVSRYMPVTGDVVAAVAAVETARRGRISPDNAGA